MASVSGPSRNPGSISWFTYYQLKRDSKAIRFRDIKQIMDEEAEAFGKKCMNEINLSSDFFSFHFST